MFVMMVVCSSGSVVVLCVGLCFVFGVFGLLLYRCGLMFE